MAKTRQRDEKYRLVTIRFPEARASELEESAKEIGLRVAPFIIMEMMKVLNARKGSVPAGDQAATVNS